MRQFQLLYVKLIFKYFPSFTADRVEMFLSTNGLDRYKPTVIGTPTIISDVNLGYGIMECVFAPEVRAFTINVLTFWTTELKNYFPYQIVQNAIVPILVLLIAIIYSFIKAKNNKSNIWIGLLLLSELMKVVLVLIAQPDTWFMYYFPTYLIGYSLLLAVVTSKVVTCSKNHCLILKEEKQKMENIDHNRKDKILLFIPMYNCEKQIVRVLDQLTEQVAKYVNEVLVVDNGSTDNGLNVVKDYLKDHQQIKISLVKNRENYNLGGSHKVAIKYAQFNAYDYLIVLHGDDQGKIADLLPYLESGEYKKYDCMLGSRFMKGSHVKNYSKFRILGNKVFNVIYSISAGKKITDMGSGLNMYRVSIFASDYHLKCRDALTFNNEMVLKSVYLKHRIKFFPITWDETDQCSNVKMMKQSFITLKLALRNFFNKKKFYLADNRVNKNFTYDCDVVKRNFDYLAPKVLITGAAGFIGSQLAYKLYKLGYRLVLIDNFSYGKLDNLIFPDHNFQNEIITMDIRDKDGIKKIMSQGDVDYVFNIAGIAPLPDNQLDPQNAIEVNVAGLVNIMENARLYGVKKVVQASTNAMYENETVFPTVEDNFKLPTLIYPNTKYCAERFLESFCKTYNMNVTCLRFANVYGPHIDCLRKQPPFVGYMIRELYYDRVPQFHSTGEQRRDYIYVDDLIDLAIRVLRTDGFDCVNCCSNTNYSVNELYSIAQKIMNKNLPATFADSENYWKKYPELYNGAYTIDKRILEHEVNKCTLCDNTFAKRKYGWQVKVGIEEGLSKVVDETCKLLAQKDQEQSK